MSSSSDQGPTHAIRRPPSLKFAAVELTVVDGPDRGASLRLPMGATRVGTIEHCGLRLSDPTVSRLHCEVRVGNDVRVVDSGSTNGTSVDGVVVLEAKLSAGCSLVVGATTIRVTFGEQPLALTLSPRESFGDVLGASTEMRRVYALMERIAPTDATVLIQGETGTGKEVVARAIHEASKRRRGPFVAVDCGAIAENLIESELFGHVRGAFSGAMTERRGLFEEADGGTIFLDEIGELTVSLQPKLLRVLEMREVRRVGANTTRKVDIRVVAATNRPLAGSVNDRTFREDLYYRLAVCEIGLPPLRARREDVPMLANAFYRRITGTEDALPDAITASLAARSWPGNVRELKNVVERSTALGWSQLQATRASAPKPERDPVPLLDAIVPTQLPLKEAREVWNDQFEALYVSSLLKRTGGNVTRAAEHAQVNRRYLHRLIAAHQIRGVRDDGGSDDD
jgi:transcriptional regulator with PAS, ATPase and Fis domain